MTTIADIRARIRQDLHDTDATSYHWPDSQLDRHIERALDELSLAIPQEKTLWLATTAGSRARLTAFSQLLHQYRRANRVRSRRLYRRLEQQLPQAEPLLVAYGSARPRLAPAGL